VEPSPHSHCAGQLQHPAFGLEDRSFPASAILPLTTKDCFDESVIVQAVALSGVDDAKEGNSLTCSLMSALLPEELVAEESASSVEMTESKDGSKSDFSLEATMEPKEEPMDVPEEETVYIEQKDEEQNVEKEEALEEKQSVEAEVRLEKEFKDEDKPQEGAEESAEEVERTSEPRQDEVLPTEDHKVEVGKEEEDAEAGQKAEVAVPLPVVVLLEAPKKRRHPRRSQKKRKKESHRGGKDSTKPSSALVTKAVRRGGLNLSVGSMPRLKGILSGRLRFIVLNISVLALLFFSLFTLFLG